MRMTLLMKTTFMRDGIIECKAGKDCVVRGLVTR